MTVPTCSGYDFPRDVIQRAVIAEEDELPAPDGSDPYG